MNKYQKDMQLSQEALKEQQKIEQEYLEAIRKIEKDYGIPEGELDHYFLGEDE